MFFACTSMTAVLLHGNAVMLAMHNNAVPDVK